MTISKVAAEANVSYAAAWRVINQVPGVSAGSRQAVVSAMQRLGFDHDGRRRHRRRRLRTRIARKSVALLICRENTLLTTSMMRIIQRMLTAAEADLIFGYVLSKADLPPAVHLRQVDGVLGYGELPASLSPALLKDIPTVWLMSPHLSLMDEMGDRVMPDHLAIGRLAADYLADRGHQHVAFFDIECNYHFGLRGFAFKEFTRRRGGNAVLLQMEQPPESRELAAGILVSRWLELSPHPTGLFVAKDGHLPHVYRQLQTHGIQIGRNVDLLSCDHQTEILDRLNPPPPSIDLNQEQIVETAVRRLLQRIESAHAEPPTQILIPPILKN